MRHHITVDNHTFSLLIDEVIRQYTFHDHGGDRIVYDGDEILFKSDEGQREALFTITHILWEGGEDSHLRICSLRLEKWARGNTIPDTEATARADEPSLWIGIHDNGMDIHTYIVLARDAASAAEKANFGMPIETLKPEDFKPTKIQDVYHVYENRWPDA